MLLQGRKIAITGAAGGLGVAVVEAVLREGAMVAAVDYSNAAGAEKAPNFHEFGGVDLADTQATKKAFAAIGTTLGGLDGLVNVAGAIRFGKVEEGDLAAWDLLYNVNLRSAVASSMFALPLLQKSGHGRIVNIGSAGAIKPEPGMGAYAASKAGIDKLTQALAAELKDKGITANAVLPTIIDTPANRKDMPKADFSRWVKPEQIADLIVFLLSDKASAITGAMIPIAGRL